MSVFSVAARPMSESDAANAVCHATRHASDGKDTDGKD
jgi:hypothetical protein